MHSLEDLLSEVKSTAREQLQAASQLQLDRIHEHIAGAWHGDLERIMEERLSDAANRIEDWHLRDAGSKLADLAANARSNARRDLAEQLGRAVRRLREFESEQQWSQALLDGTKGFCDRAAVFIVNGPSLELRGIRGMEPQVEKQAALKVALSAAPAFATAVETKDTVVAMRTRGELSEPVASLVGESPGHRSSLFPLTTRDRVPALLYADSSNQDIEPAALEMLCSVASVVLESVAANRRPESSELVKIIAPEPEPARATTWFALDREEQNLHLRAQRFARVLVAGMRLYKAQAVKSGRTERDLYKHLQSDIDTGRQTFRDDFLSKSNSMVDYLHLELVRTLANEDAGLLGSQYPGPMA